MDIQNTVLRKLQTENSDSADTLMTVAFFQTILEPYAMPYVPEQCIGGLMQDEELAAAVQK